MISSFMSSWLGFGVGAFPVVMAAIILMGHRLSVQKWPLYFFLFAVCVVAGQVAFLGAMILGLIAVVDWFDKEGV